MLFMAPVLHGLPRLSLTLPPPLLSSFTLLWPYWLSLGLGTSPAHCIVGPMHLIFPFPGMLFSQVSSWPLLLITQTPLLIIVTQLSLFHPTPDRHSSTLLYFIHNQSIFKIICFCFYDVYLPQLEYVSWGQRFCAVSPALGTGPRTVRWLQPALILVVYTGT